jgi:hypothetical protein
MDVDGNHANVNVRASRVTDCDAQHVVPDVALFTPQVPYYFTNTAITPANRQPGLSNFNFRCALADSLYQVSHQQHRLCYRLHGAVRACRCGFRHGASSALVSLDGR